MTKKTVIASIAGFSLIVGAMLLFPQQKASAKLFAPCPAVSAPYMHAVAHAANGGSSHSHYAGLERYDMPPEIQNCAESTLRGSATVAQGVWGGEYTQTPTQHRFNVYGSMHVDKDIAVPRRITNSSFTYTDSYMVTLPGGDIVPGSNGIINYSQLTTNLGTIDGDQSKGSRQSVTVDKSRMNDGYNWICVEGKIDFTYNGIPYSTGGGGWCVELFKAGPPIIVSQYCNGTAVQASISWPAGGSDIKRYSLQIDTEPFAADDNYWFRGPIFPPSTNVPDVPNSFVPFGDAVGSLTLQPGLTYYARVFYGRSAIDWSGGATGDYVPFTARSDCVPPTPVPPPPTVTPTCTANKPTFDITWNAVAGLSPTSFTVDLDDNNFAGGTDWLYKDVSSAGPGPYSALSAPNSFLSFGAGPAVPLNPGSPYQFRVNYRGAGAGGADVVSPTDTKTARTDCVPVPPPPTVTPTCTANKPTFDITWNAVAGLSPTSFTVDLDDNNFAGGTDWLYKDVSSAGPGPYSALSAPNSFLSFGAGPAVPLNPGSPYQFRVNYRGAGAGGADVPTSTVTRNARTDCIPPPSITCVSVNPSIVEASPTPYDVQVGYQNASGSTTLTGATVTARVATAPMQSTATAVSPDLPGDGSVRLAPLLNIFTPIPGEYDVSLVFTGGNTPGSPLTVNCAQKLAAYNGPYFRVFGGDVMTGGYNSATCSAWPQTLNSLGSIFAFNKSDGTPAMSGKGAGTQLLVQATRTVSGFSSAQHRTSPPYPPAPQPAHDKGLTFANNDGASQFGGAFNIGSCPPDYFANKSDTASASNPLAQPPASQVSGPYIVNAGSVTSSPVHTIGNGKSIVLYVNGNAYITGDIVYQAGPWSLVNDIPSFTLVAKGNIYITENVTRLDGIYIAQPASVAPGDGGTLYTCSITPPAVPTAAQVASQCTSPLTINGAVMARSIKLLRSSGTAREANPADCPLSLPASNIYNCTGSSTAAEQFIYTPEIWIRSNSLRRSSRPSSYDVVSNLPPIL